MGFRFILFSQKFLILRFTSGVMVPNLDRHGSGWAVIRLTDNQTIMELHRNSKLAVKINFDKYKLVPVGQYLGEINKQILMEQGCHDSEKYGICRLCQSIFNKKVLDS